MRKMKRFIVLFITFLLAASQFYSLSNREVSNQSHPVFAAVGDNQTMMQYFEWYLPNDGQHWNKLNSEASSLSDNGITALWLPPAYKGSTQNDVGYGVYDMYDLGEFNQKGTIRTKYGTKAELKAAIDKAHSYGISVYGDTVMNHRLGADGIEQAPAVEVNSSNRNQVTSGSYNIGAWTSYTFPGRSVDPGKTTKFEWKWYHFDGVDYNNNNGQNKIFKFDSAGKSWDWEVDGENGNYDYLMGADLDFSHPEVAQEMKDWGEWYQKELNLDGYRLDAVKHIQFQYLKDWTAYQRQKAGKYLFTVGEYWSPDYTKLDNFQNKTNNEMSLFDAPLHYRFYSASTGNGGYDLRTLQDNTMMLYNPTKAVTLVDNHDTQAGQSLQSEVLDWFKPQAYNYILLHEAGYPSVFYKDYYHPTYGPMIQKLVKARKLYAYGTEHSYRNTTSNTDTGDLVGWTREGDSSHANSGIASLVSDNGSDVQTKWMEVGRQHAGETWYDYTGNLTDTVTINADGWGEFKVKGSSQSVWVKKVENQKPTLSGVANTTIQAGSQFNLLDGVQATDSEDGDLTSKITTTGTVDTTKAGQYEIVYSVIDSTGQKVSVSRVITVEGSIGAPVINGASAKELVVDTEFDPLQGVSSSDTKGVDLTANIKITGSVDTTKPGVYNLIYSITDSYNQTVTVNRQITVVEKPIVCQNNQIIDGEYRFYVSDCSTKKIIYSLQFATYEDNIAGTSEAIRGFQYYPNAVYDGKTDKVLDGTQQNHVLYEYEMKSTEKNITKPRHGIVEYGAKYNDNTYPQKKATAQYEYYDHAEFMKNHSLKIKRILNLDATGAVRTEVRRADNSLVATAAFEFFNRLPYTKGGNFSENNNIKTTYKLTGNSLITYAYGKQTQKGYSYLYKYATSTYYDGTQGSKIVQTIVQAAPTDLPQY